MTPTLAEALDAIEARAKAATAGPWEANPSMYPRPPYDEDGEERRDESEWDAISSGDYEVVGYYRCGSHHLSIAPADAAFIVASRTDVPALVAALRKVAADLNACTDYRSQSHRDETLRAVLALLTSRPTVPDAPS